MRACWSWSATTTRPCANRRWLRVRRTVFRLRSLGPTCSATYCAMRFRPIAWGAPCTRIVRNCACCSDLNPHPMWLFNGTTSKFLAVNRAAIRIYGYSEQEFLSMSVADVRARMPVELPRVRAGGNAGYLRVVRHRTRRRRRDRGRNLRTGGAVLEPQCAPRPGARRDRRAPCDACARGQRTPLPRPVRAQYRVHLHPRPGGHAAVGQSGRGCGARSQRRRAAGHAVARPDCAGAGDS